MNEATFRDHVNRLKEAVRGQDVAARIGLHGRGNRFFCPVCQPGGGKTPDLDVFDQGFKCYKCGKTGDIIDLAVMAGGMSKADAIGYIEQLAGVKRPTGRGKGPGLSSSHPKIGRPGRADAVEIQGKAEKRSDQPPTSSSDLYVAFLKTVWMSGALFGATAEEARRMGFRRIIKGPGVASALAASGARGATTSHGRGTDFRNTHITSSSPIRPWSITAVGYGPGPLGIW